MDYYKTLKKSFQNPLEILKPIKKTPLNPQEILARQKNTYKPARNFGTPGKKRSNRKKATETEEKMETDIAKSPKLTMHHYL